MDLGGLAGDREQRPAPLAPQERVPVREAVIDRMDADVREHPTSGFEPHDPQGVVDACDLGRFGERLENRMGPSRRARRGTRASAVTPSGTCIQIALSTIGRRGAAVHRHAAEREALAQPAFDRGAIGPLLRSVGVRGPGPCRRVDERGVDRVLARAERGDHRHDLAFVRAVAGAVRGPHAPGRRCDRSPRSWRAARDARVGAPWPTNCVEAHTSGRPVHRRAVSMFRDAIVHPPKRLP